MNTVTDIPIKHFYIIRHGETVANAEKYMAGSLDSPLTKLGRRQAYETHDILKSLEVKPELIVHSHLSRARDTATIINEVLNVPMIEEPGFAEMDTGDWEGAPYSECAHLFHEWIDAPNGESAEEFFNRIRNAKKNLFNTYDVPLLIVCHGGVMRAVGQLQNVKTPGKFENAHLHEFTPQKAKDSFPWTVWNYNQRQGSEGIQKNLSPLYHPELSKIA